MTPVCPWDLNSAAQGGDFCLADETQDLAAFSYLSIRTLCPPGCVPEGTSSSFPIPLAFRYRQIHCSDVLWFWVLGMVRIGETLQLVFDSSKFGFHARKKEERQGDL